MNNPMPAKMLSMGPDFPRRVLRMSLLLSACILVLSTLYRNFTLSLGLGTGMFVSVASLWTLMGMGRILGNPKGKKAAVVGLTLFVKYPLLVLLLYFSLRSWGASPVGVAVGVSLVPAVILLKIIGILWVNNMNAGDEGERDSSAGGKGPRNG